MSGRIRLAKAHETHRTEDDALQLGKLPSVHQGPFDRMLIRQAIANQAVQVTPDPLIARYPVSVQW